MSKVKLSTAEKNLFQQLEQQKRNIENQMIELTNSILESRDITLENDSAIELSDDFSVLVIP